jgi:hypothetical protein
MSAQAQKAARKGTKGIESNQFLFFVHVMMLPPVFNAAGELTEWRLRRCVYCLFAQARGIDAVDSLKVTPALMHARTHACTHAPMHPITTRTHRTHSRTHHTHTPHALMHARKEGGTHACTHAHTHPYTHTHT